ncbi:MAG: RluA family pseudouridine synthase [Candidatus Cloacimonetes bacterium]|nr:RluA family pseudouridine synthase [Candidatus Cloacimonadota bacterium]
MIDNNHNSEKKDIEIQNKISFNVPDLSEDEKIRIDKYIASLDIDELYSRSFIDKLIKKNLITLDGKNIKKSELLHGNEHIEILIPVPPHKNITPEKIELDIVYEDRYLAIINKPAGMVVHPAPGHYSGTLVNALLYHYQNLPGSDDNLRPGIVHRLDKDTSGLIIIAKTPRAKSLLKQLFQRHEVEKIYLTFSLGWWNDSKGTINTNYGRNPNNRKKMSVLKKGKTAVTHYEVMQTYPGFQLTKVFLETGRTHQIRVHFSHYNHPIMGDKVYSTKKRSLSFIPIQYKNKFRDLLANTLQRQALHAHQLEFIHPITQNTISVTSDLPEDMQQVLGEIEREIE